MTCPACNEPTVAGASFCEACGAHLGPPAPACVSCGSADKVSDGYCLICGHKQPAARDHLEIDLGIVAGVTDRGQRHHHNEDALALAAIAGGAVVVVCDGVSTTDNSDLASQAAADGALQSLLKDIEHGAELSEAMTEAASIAQEAVIQVPPKSDGQGNPSCTFVAAVVRQAEVTVGWLGDSRAYWIGEDPKQLTVDHSWAVEAVAEGIVSQAEAAVDPRGSTITRWLGRDAPDIVPSVATYSFETGGRVLVCSDGLWHYTGNAADLAAQPALQKGALIEQARGLAAFANDSGGHDNITVAIVALADSGATAP